MAGSILTLGICFFLYFRGMFSPEAGTIEMLVSLVSVSLLSLFGRRTAAEEN